MPCKKAATTKWLGEMKFLASLGVFARHRARQCHALPAPCATAPRCGMKDKAQRCRQSPVLAKPRLGNVV